MSDEDFDVSATQSKPDVEDAVTGNLVFTRSAGRDIAAADSLLVWNRMCQHYGFDYFQLLPQPESNNGVAQNVAAGQNLFPHIQSNALMEMQNMSFGNLTFNTLSEAEDSIRDVYIGDVADIHASNNLPLGQPLHFSYPGLDERTTSTAWQPPAPLPDMILLTPILPPGPLSGQVGIEEQTMFKSLPSPVLSHETEAPGDEVIINKKAATALHEQLISLEDMQEVYDYASTRVANSIQNQNAATEEKNDALLENVIHQMNENPVNRQICHGNEDYSSKNSASDEEITASAKHIVGTNYPKLQLNSEGAANFIDSDLDIAAEAATIAALRSVSETFDPSGRSNTHCMHRSAKSEQRSFNTALDAILPGPSGTCEQATSSHVNLKVPLLCGTLREELMEKPKLEETGFFASHLSKFKISKRSYSRSGNVELPTIDLNGALEGPVNNPIDQHLLFMDKEDAKVLDMPQTNSFASCTINAFNQNGTTRDSNLREPACQRCRRRKIRCDRTKPSCLKCLKVKPDHECLYVAREKTRNDTPKWVRRKKLRNIPSLMVESAQEDLSGVQEGKTSSTRLRNPKQGHPVYVLFDRENETESSKSPSKLFSDYRGTSNEVVNKNKLHFAGSKNAFTMSAGPITQELRATDNVYEPLHEQRLGDHSQGTILHFATKDQIQTPTLGGNALDYDIETPRNADDSLRLAAEISGRHSFMSSPPQPQLMARCDSAPSKATNCTPDEATCLDLLPYRERLQDLDAPLTHPLISAKLDRISYFPPETEKKAAAGASTACLQTSYWSETFPVPEAGGDTRGPPSCISRAIADLQVESSQYMSPYISKPVLPSTPIDADMVATTRELGSWIAAPGKPDKDKKSIRPEKEADQAPALLANDRMQCYHSCRVSLSSQRTGEGCRHAYCSEGVVLPAMPADSSSSPTST